MQAFTEAAAEPQLLAISIKLIPLKYLKESIITNGSEYAAVAFEKA